MVIDLKDADGKYLQIMRRAADRGIDFQMTFEEWMTVWLDSGHWHQRGKGLGKYNMSRINDTGPYAVGNVFIQRHEQNSSDGHRGKSKSAEHNLKNSLGQRSRRPTEQTRLLMCQAQQRRRARSRLETE
jgi:hypothetical protein